MSPQNAYLLNNLGQPFLISPLLWCITVVKLKLSDFTRGSEEAQESYIKALSFCHDV